MQQATVPLTFIQRSRAFTRFPSRFSSKPQPCQAAACLLFATVAASNNCRGVRAVRTPLGKVETCWKHRTGLLMASHAATYTLETEESGMLPPGAAHLACIARVAQLALQYSPGLPDKFVLASCTCHKAP